MSPGRIFLPGLDSPSSSPCSSKNLRCRFSPLLAWLPLPPCLDQQSFRQALDCKSSRLRVSTCCRFCRIRRLCRFLANAAEADTAAESADTVPRAATAPVSKPAVFLVEPWTVQTHRQHLLPILPISSALPIPPLPPPCLNQRCFVSVSPARIFLSGLDSPSSSPCSSRNLRCRFFPMLAWLPLPPCLDQQSFRQALDCKSSTLRVSTRCRFCRLCRFRWLCRFCAADPPAAQVCAADFSRRWHGCHRPNVQTSSLVRQALDCPVPRSRERCRIASQPPRRRAPGGARGGRIGATWG